MDSGDRRGYVGEAGTHVSYRVSADGRRAIERGDAAEVVARRIPD